MSSFKPCNPITEYDDDECEFEDGGEEVEEDGDEEVEEDDSDDVFDAEEKKKFVYERNSIFWNWMKVRGLRSPV